MLKDRLIHGLLSRKNLNLSIRSSISILAHKALVTAICILTTFSSLNIYTKMFLSSIYSAGPLYLVVNTGVPHSCLYWRHTKPSPLKQYKQIKCLKVSHFTFFECGIYNKNIVMIDLASIVCPRFNHKSNFIIIAKAAEKHLINQLLSV